MVKIKKVGSDSTENSEKPHTFPQLHGACASSCWPIQWIGRVAPRHLLHAV